MGRLHDFYADVCSVHTQGNHEGFSPRLVKDIMPEATFTKHDERFNHEGFSPRLVKDIMLEATFTKHDERFNHEGFSPRLMKQGA